MSQYFMCVSVHMTAHESGSKMGNLVWIEVMECHRIMWNILNPLEQVILPHVPFHSLLGHISHIAITFDLEGVRSYNLDHFKATHKAFPMDGTELLIEVFLNEHCTPLWVWRHVWWPSGCLNIFTVFFPCDFSIRPFCRTSLSHSYGPFWAFMDQRTQH